MHGSDFAATMYESKDPDIYVTDEVDVNRVDMVEFEGDAFHSMYKCHDAPHYPTEYVSRGFIESEARRELPEHVTAEFEDDEPGAAYPTQ